MAYGSGHGSGHDEHGDQHGEHDHGPQSWVTRYVWSQDHKVIAVQYSLTAIVVGLIGLVLSDLMRLQLGYPGKFSFIDASTYYQFITMHGMIMVVYLLTALFLGGFGNYLIPLMVGARDMVFPFLNMLSFWFYLLSVVILIGSFFVPGGPTGACCRWVPGPGRAESRRANTYQSPGTTTNTRAGCATSPLRSPISAARALALNQLRRIDAGTHQSKFSGTNPSNAVAASTARAKVAKLAFDSGAPAPIIFRCGFS
eukprot:gene36132-40869_t